MSVPISNCLVVAAAKGDEKAYQKLVECMSYNYACGHWTNFGCSCNPPCTATDEQIQTLHEKMEKEQVIIDAHTALKNRYKR